MELACPLPLPPRQISGPRLVLALTALRAGGEGGVVGEARLGKVGGEREEPVGAMAATSVRSMGVAVDKAEKFPETRGPFGLRLTKLLNRCRKVEV